MAADVNANFWLNNKGELVDGNDAVRLRLRNLLECPQGGYPFNRAVGCRLDYFLFEQSDWTVDELRESLFQSIRTYMPEIVVNRQKSKVYQDDNGLLHIEIAYIVLADKVSGQYTATVKTR